MVERLGDHFTGYDTKINERKVPLSIDLAWRWRRTGNAIRINAYLSPFRNS